MTVVSSRLFKTIISLSANYIIFSLNIESGLLNSPQFNFRRFNVIHAINFDYNSISYFKKIKIFTIFMEK
jgi:hypothetical protein